MRELTIDEIKDIEIHILNYIDMICQENSICYSLSGGTLLGAIRHKGFIPWDDDIDVFMTRDNYNRFIKVVQGKESQYKLITYKNSKNYNYLHSKVVSLNTHLVDYYDKPVEDMGVFVDLFPVDNLGRTKQIAINTIKSIRLKKYLGVASNWKKFHFKKFKSFKRQLIRFVFYYVCRFINPKKGYEIIESLLSNIKDNEYMGIACGVYEFKEIMTSEIFTEYISVEFEGKEYMSIKNYDLYLKNLYGDYMKLPPENQRVTHHGFKAYLKEKGE